MIYVALLRGINVGAHNRMKMQDLVSLFGGLGFENIKTYLQSGNVVFSSKAGTHENSGFRSGGLKAGNVEAVSIRKAIESAISEHFGFDVTVIIRTIGEMIKTANENPFLKDASIQPDKLHVAFLSDAQAAEKISKLALRKDENERYSIERSEVYLYCPNGYGNTKMNNTAIEKLIGTLATTRNWNSVMALAELIQSASGTGHE
jgi:uncharacterized protein (DUF1697 family)